jgi:2-C-methyl-D-erythritol 4-phosphate cytidylyltransferase
VLAVVPVVSGSALRSPAGRPLLLEALELLGDGEVVVTAGPSELGAVRGLVPGTAVLAVPAGVPAAVLAALRARPGGGAVLVLDPLQVHTPPQLVPAVLEALRGAAAAAGSGPHLEPLTVPGGGPPDAVVPVRPVTDTLKRVGADGAVHGTEDRERFRWALTPQAYRRDVLERVLELALAQVLAGGTAAPGDGPAALPRLLARHGARVATLAAAVDVLRADGEDGFELAAAVHGGPPGPGG